MSTDNKNTDDLGWLEEKHIRKDHAERLKKFAEQDYEKLRGLSKTEEIMRSKANLKKGGYIDKNGFLRDSYVDVAKDLRRTKEDEN